jgi:hypothetical protein
MRESAYDAMSSARKGAGTRFNNAKKSARDNWVERKERIRQQKVDKARLGFHKAVRSLLKFASSVGNVIDKLEEQLENMDSEYKSNFDGLTLESAKGRGKQAVDDLSGDVSAREDTIQQELEQTYLAAVKEILRLRSQGLKYQNELLKKLKDVPTYDGVKLDGRCVVRPKRVGKGENKRESARLKKCGQVWLQKSEKLWFEPTRPDSRRVRQELEDFVVDGTQGKATYNWDSVPAMTKQTPAHYRAAKRAIHKRRDAVQAQAQQAQQA